MIATGAAREVDLAARRRAIIIIGSLP